MGRLRAIAQRNHIPGERYLVAYGRARLAVAAQLPSQRLAAGIGVLLGRIGNPLGSPRALGPRGRVFAEKIASSPRGDLAIAATVGLRTSRNTDREAIYVAQRPLGRRFRRPVRVSPSARELPFDVAVDGRGNALIAWRRGDVIEARVITETGRLRPLQRLGQAHHAAAPRAAIGSSLRAIVVWEGQKLGRGPEPYPVVSPTVVRLASAGPGARFGRAVTLDRFADDRAWLGGCGAPRNADVAMDSRGRSVIAWTGRAQGHFTLRVATPAGIQTFSDGVSDACLGGLAVASNGIATVTWSQGNRLAGAQVRAAVRGPGTGPFGHAEVVGEEAVFPPSAAINPITQEPFAAWYTHGRIRYTSRVIPTTTPGS